MTEEMRLLWELRKEKYSTKELLELHENPLNLYKEESIEGPIIDIGCGQSTYVLEYYKKSKKVYAIDSDDFQLNSLKERADDIKTAESGEIIYINGIFPAHKLPNEIFSIVVLSNFLHFFSLKNCHKIIDKISSHTTAGSLILTQVHSSDHYVNQRKQKSHFKHFFQKADLDELFIPRGFERMYFAQIEHENSQSHDAIVHEWIRRVHNRVYNSYNEDIIKKEAERYLEGNRQTHITSIYRKT